MEAVRDGNGTVMVTSKIYCTLEFFLENGQNKTENYKIKIYNQFYFLKLFYLKNINILKHYTGDSVFVP